MNSAPQIVRNPDQARYASDEERWQAIMQKDRNADGRFYFSVKSTGVYCRPSCPARLANRENVAFHETSADAERDGFRACKRCKPKEPALTEQYAATVAAACGTIETAEQLPTLGALADSVGMSPYYFHRVFKATTVGFVEAPKLGFDLPLDVRGTAFQQRVWQALREIPVGSTASYSEIAKRIGRPKAVRAVAQACASNAIAVAIPCHRVLRTDGDLSGYRWGVERKAKLLKREKARSTDDVLKILGAP
jgi:AraC family transcriptional regulator, regulatory protein of adaptative response / methylated-DNA-[protein]-cysteine methyltransferase